jgi:hypothetical protein
MSKSSSHFEIVPENARVVDLQNNLLDSVPNHLKNYKMHRRDLLAIISILVFLSCSKRHPEQKVSDDLVDLKDFPKEWVLVANENPPDSITSKYVIYTDSVGDYFSQVMIEQNANQWQLTKMDRNQAFRYTIAKCNRTEEREMKYYNFDLLGDDNVGIKLRVNFRHDEVGLNTSVFNFSDASGDFLYDYGQDDNRNTIYHSNFEVVAKKFASKFPHQKVDVTYD